MYKKLAKGVVSFNEDIFECTFHEHHSIEKDDIEELISEIKKIEKTTIPPSGLLFNLTTMVFLNQEARHFLDRMSDDLFTGMAFLVSTELQTQMAKLYIDFKRSQIPVKIFTNRNDANDWLESMTKVII